MLPNVSPSSSPPSSESQYSSAPCHTGVADMERALEAVLRIPRANRMVSDFLFGNILHSPFHRQYALPPSALASSVAIRLEEQISSSIVDITEKLMSPLKACDAPSDHFDAFLDTLFIPVCHRAPYAFGYCFTVEESENPFCFPGSPFKSPDLGRFVFDTRSGDLLKICFGGSPSSIGLHSMHNRVFRSVVPTSATPSATGLTEQIQQLACSCEHEVLTVPAVPYEWPHLPSTVLWKISTQITRDLTGVGDILGSGMGMDNNTNNNNLNHQQFRPVQNLTPWPLTASGTYHDRSTPSPSSDQEGSIFCLKDLADVVDSLTTQMSGRYRAPGFRVDVLKQLGPKPESQLVDTKVSNKAVGRISFITPPPERTMRIREHFASSYYLASFSPSADMALSVQRANPPRIRPEQRHCATSSDMSGLIEWLATAGSEDVSNMEAWTETNNRAYHDSSTVNGLIPRESSSSTTRSATEDVLSGNVWCMNNGNGGMEVNLPVELDMNVGMELQVAHGSENTNIHIDPFEVFSTSEPHNDSLAWNFPSPVLDDHAVVDFADSDHDKNSSSPTDNSDKVVTSTSGCNGNSNSVSSPPSLTLPSAKNNSVGGYISTSKTPSPEAGMGGKITGVAVLAPRPNGVLSQGAGEAESQAKCQVVSKSGSSPSKRSDEQARREMLEARRRRNRISAARSNEKKRAMVEQLKRDMAAQKERARQLKAVQQRALAENQVLKARLQLQQGNVAC